MNINMLDHVRGFIPAEVRDEMNQIETEMYEAHRKEHLLTRSMTASNVFVAAALVWCVRELAAARRQ